MKFLNLLLAALVVFFALAATARAECPSGNCPRVAAGPIVQTVGHVALAGVKVAKAIVLAPLRLAANVIERGVERRQDRREARRARRSGGCG